SAFDEIAKKDVRGVALIRLNLSHQHEAYSAYEQAFEEYITYFKTKQKAGVVRFTEGSSDETTFLLYLLPADELVVQTVLPGMTAPDKSFVAVLASV
ncbi:MAG: uncharacterized protein KVP18_002557, partial [Porospora cf. gigantea A]|uniref:uncharacterized protein n=1 Tax=Porospora cf. gigantea A TaxID=2853593 RepID=UPI003559682D